MMEFRDAYIAANQWDNSLTLIKWGLDWLVKAHVKAGDSPAENAFVGQVCCHNDLETRVCRGRSGASRAKKCVVICATDISTGFRASQALQQCMSGSNAKSHCSRLLPHFAC
jgi:hypothetical protein